MNRERRRVVITGMGVVAPNGIGVPTFRDSLREGVSGIGPLTRFPREGFKSKYAFEVKNFNPLKGTHLLDPFIQYALHATEEAQRMAGVDLARIDPFQIGIVVSSSKGGLHSFHEFHDRFLKRPSAILGARVYANLVPNFASQWIARKWKIQGPAKNYITACSTGTTSVIEGTRLVEEGVVDYAIAGASDASLVPFLVAGYEKMKVLSPDGIFPFDRRRKGFLLGEGAGIVFLESLESAQARGAKLYAEVLGYAYGTDAYHPVSFNAQGDTLARTLQALLENAKISDSEINYLNLHGTATREGDLYETNQIKKALGEQAFHLASSSIKSMVGHMLGASGAVEVIACCLALQEGFVPPTIGLEEPDPQCDLDYTPGKAREKKVQVAVSISMGFGGHVAAIALGKV